MLCWIRNARNSTDKVQLAEYARKLVAQWYDISAASQADTFQGKACCAAQPRHTMLFKR